VFLTGTVAELTPVREIDDRPVGSGEPGDVTREIQRHFEDALRGRSDRYAEWLDVVPSAATRRSAHGDEAGAAVGFDDGARGGRVGGGEHDDFGDFLGGGDVPGG
jgi:hypothetical protein